MRLDELRRLERDGSEGPWDYEWGCDENGNDYYEINGHVFYCETEDAELIAAARNALPALLRFVACAELDRCREGECECCDGVRRLLATLTRELEGE